MMNTWQLLTLQRGGLRLTILPGVGGRLWDVEFDGVSLLFKNPYLSGYTVDLDKLDQLPTRSPQFSFPLWGGEKTWIAPDSSWVKGAPYPVLDSGAYAVSDQSADHVELHSQLCPLSHLRVIRTIRLLDTSGFCIDHCVINEGPASRLTGIWSVMMVSRPSTIMAATDPTKVRTVFGDPEPFLNRRGSRLDLPCDRPGEFKVGFDVPSGRLELELGPTGRRVRLACDVPPMQPGQTYAHGHNVEIFNSGELPYCEAEWHSPALDLLPRFALRYRQSFDLSRPADSREPTFRA